jgi:UrcA family protein
VKSFMHRAASVAALVALTGLIPCIGTAATVFAESVPTREVYYGDLDLDSKAGVTALQARLARAARQVCGGYERVRLEEASWQKQCREKAIADAVAAVNEPLLTQHYSKRVLLSAR